MLRHVIKRLNRQGKKGEAAEAFLPFYHYTSADSGIRLK
ncbi:hypothetical protein HMPREF9413_1797 [Paenibacillus sp. HGF7]|nr:hypothetical protein HMPREF9413_1797 [Paenibacillus sp. HGF7]